MKSSDKFEEITTDIKELTLAEIHTFCWLLLGGDKCDYGKEKH